MALSPWTVALLSTGYDMRDVRAEVARDIADQGFDVLAYERPGYPVQPGTHSHEACVLAVDQADIAVVMIDKRYGGLYIGVGDISVTEKEYQTATRKGKIVIPCVRKEAWEERHILFSKFKGKRKRSLSSSQRLATTYVEKWEVLEFIERVRKADRDNFVIIFDDVVDLKNQLRGRLEGLSHYLLKQLVTRQMAVVRNIKTTTGLAFSLGDVLDKGYFVEPPFRLLSGSLNRRRTLTTLSADVPDMGSCMAILGEPGSGKSTLLGRAYLQHAKRCLKTNSMDLPFFVSLRGRGEFSFCYRDHVAECFAVLMQKKPYPLIDLSHTRPSFYIDGLDELTEERSRFDVDVLCKSDMYGFPFMIASRSLFASQFLDDMAFGGRLSRIIELQPWDVSVTTKYIDEFCRIRNCHNLKGGLKQAFASGGEMTEIADNPLLLTLFLCLVEEAGMSIPLQIRDKRTLLSRTLKAWAKREIGRTRGQSSVDAEEAELLLQAWRVAGWQLYCNRFSATPGIRLNDLLSMVKEANPRLMPTCERDAFIGLFDVRPHTDLVTGVVHEQLLEELVAELLAEGMQRNQFPFPDSLSVAVRWEINQIIRSIWAETPEPKLRETLSNLVRATLSKTETTDKSGALRRNQATYYIGRLGIPEAIMQLRGADTTEKNIFVRLSIGFGLMKCLQFDIEEEFVNRLRRFPDWDAANRGYHLFYYQDWHTNDIEPPYTDPGNIPWQNTLRALMRHIESAELKHIAIRRVELITIRRFLETRQTTAPMTNDVMDRICTAVEKTLPGGSPSVPADFVENLRQEYKTLKSAWQAVSGMP